MANTLKSFDLEFQPFTEEINIKEGIIREFADAATMERVRSTYNYRYGLEGAERRWIPWGKS